MTLIDKAEAMAVLRKAQTASCTCQIKTPDPEWHSHNCRYRILREAEAMIDHLPDADPAALAVPEVAAQTDAVRDILTERARQVSAEGWTPEHDDAHDNGELAQSAACYALSSLNWPSAAIWEIWPKRWSARWFKRTNRRRDLVKAGALILAEIERLDRAALRAVEGRG